MGEREGGREVKRERGGGEGGEREGRERGREVEVKRGREGEREVRGMWVVEVGGPKRQRSAVA